VASSPSLYLLGPTPSTWLLGGHSGSDNILNIIKNIDNYNINLVIPTNLGVFYVCPRCVTLVYY
jgi:hypothetical protein